MRSCSAVVVQQAGVAFDRLAEHYDEIFTESLIGRAQRDAVWDVLRCTFHSGQRILELNCGTGEDALFLARMGLSVYACDASEQMIAVAARRIAKEQRGAQVQLAVLPTERISELRHTGAFDGALSNFSGLNCVADLTEVSRQLAKLIRPGGQLVLCLSSRICLWESLWYFVHGDSARAVRRWKGHATASVGAIGLTVRYPRMRDVRRSFHPFFALRDCKGIGVTVPPSYMEPLGRKYPVILRKLQAIDRAVSSWPLCRVLGDHILLQLERTSS